MTAIQTHTSASGPSSLQSSHTVSAICSAATDERYGAQLSERHQSARHGPLGAILCVFLIVLVLVRHAQLEEQAEQHQHRHQHCTPVRRGLAQQGRQAHGRGAERHDQHAVLEYGKALRLIFPQPRAKPAPGRISCRWNCSGFAHGCLLRLRLRQVLVSAGELMRTQRADDGQLARKAQSRRQLPQRPARCQRLSAQEC